MVQEGIYFFCGGRGGGCVVEFLHGILKCRVQVFSILRQNYAENYLKSSIPFLRLCILLEFDLSNVLSFPGVLCFSRVGVFEICF